MAPVGEVSAKSNTNRTKEVPGHGSRICTLWNGPWFHSTSVVKHINMTNQMTAVSEAPPIYPACTSAMGKSIIARDDGTFPFFCQNQINVEIIPFTSIYNRVKRSDGTAHGTMHQRHDPFKADISMVTGVDNCKTPAKRKSIIVCDESLQTGSKSGSIRIMRVK